MAKKQKLGTVVRTGLQTARVRVDRMVRHPIYLKAYRTSRSFLVDVPSSIHLGLGDQVLIEEVRPVSKRKSWQVLRVVTQGQAAGVTATKPGADEELA